MRGFAAFRGRRRPRLPYRRLSAFSRIAQVLRTTTSASAASSVATIPSDVRSPAIRSESCSFIWHPNVRTRNRPDMSFRLPPRLSRVLHRSELPHDRDADLTGVLELLLHLLGDVPRQHLRLQIVDALGLDHHADLPAGLHREGLLDARMGVTDLLEPLQALHVGLEALAAGAGTAAGDRVGRLREHRVDRALLHLAVMGLDDV